MHYNGAVSGCKHHRDVVITRSIVGSIGRRPPHVVGVPLRVMVRGYVTVAVIEDVPIIK